MTNKENLIKEEIMNMNREEFLEFYNENFELISKVLFENEDILRELFRKMAE